MVMDYHGIDMKGKLLLERLSAIPGYASADEGRIIYLTTDGNVYVANDSEYTLLSSLSSSVETSSFTASAGDIVIAEGGNTVTLPSGPSAGDTIFIIPGNDWTSSNLTVDRNGEDINNSANNLTCDINTLVALSYKSAAWGWAVG